MSPLRSKVAAGAFADHEWRGRTIEYHRAQIRQALGFHAATSQPLRQVHFVGEDALNHDGIQVRERSLKQV